MYGSRTLFVGSFQIFAESCEVILLFFYFSFTENNSNFEISRNFSEQFALRNSGFFIFRLGAEIHHPRKVVILCPRKKRTRRESTGISSRGGTTPTHHLLWSHRSACGPRSARAAPFQATALFAGAKMGRVCAQDFKKRKEEHPMNEPKLHFQEGGRV